MKNTPNSVLLIGLLFLLTTLFISCSEEAQIDTTEFLIDEGLQIELVAAEPDVVLPVAMVEDPSKRLWVVEMPGYMRDIDGSDEDLPDGRIVILSDTDKDGRMDNRQIFLDSLLNPRAICLAYGGLLYTDGTSLKWVELIGTTKGRTETVDSFYVVGGNIEHQPNGLLYNLDNWIYSAKSNARYRKIDGQWLKQATTFRGQWGITNDRNGRLFYNHNSAPIMGDYSMPNQTLDNPFLQLQYSYGQYLTDDMRIFPIQATSVNRGYMPEVLDSTGKVIHYTSACAPHMYYGGALDGGFEASAFVCAPEANLIAQYRFDEDNMTVERTTDNQEFLISKDESFRPVNLMTGFDGNLYIVDMRKGIIQHSAYMSSYLREAITRKKLDKINGKGRIYKIANKQENKIGIDLTNLTMEEWVELLGHKNMKIRMFAQQSFIEKGDKESIDMLTLKALDTSSVLAQTHALWTLEGLQALTPEFILRVSDNTSDVDVLHHLLILTKTVTAKDGFYDSLYQKSIRLRSEKIDFILASISGKRKSTRDLWKELAQRYPNHKTIVEALVSGIDDEAYFLDAMVNKEKDTLSSVLLATQANRIKNEIYAPVLIEEPYDDDRTNGLKKYKQYCASCHGMDGKGQPKVAPSLKSSAIIQGKEVEIARIILNGYDTGGDFQIMMPAYKEDVNLNDQDIWDIISYLKSTYTTGWNSLKVEEVTTIRNELKSDN